MKGITRRSFVLGSAALAAGRWAAATLPALAGGGMGGGGMGGGIIDPPVGPAFANPPLLADASTDPQVVDVALRAVRSRVRVNGTSANLLTYNGQHPGGMIRVRNDQLLRIRVTNALPNNGATNLLGHPKYDTNLHTHGLHVTPGDNANGTHGDNMMVMLRPGQSTTYEYDLSKHPGGNLNFYHPHLHGSVADQMFAGMAGPLIVEDETDVLSGYAEKVMVLKDLSLVGSEPAAHDSMMDYMHGLEGSIVMVNGQVNPRLTIAPGQVQRWRIVNACTARFFRLSLQGHTMQLVGTDGGLLDKPYPLTELLLSPGERADLLVKADAASASYKFLSLPYTRMGNMGGQQVTLLTLTYAGNPMPQTLPVEVNPSAKRVVIDPMMPPTRKTMDLSMGHGRGYINGVSFQDHDHAFATHSMLGMWEVWTVTNSSGMDHPFHHHVNHAQVLSISGGDAKYRDIYTKTPAWKDVTIVPKWGSVELLVPVMDYEGMAMVHCHIIEHEDIGMMGVWHLMKGEM